MSDQFNLVRVGENAFSIHSVAYGETMHPAIGPVAEAEGLYVRQLQIPQRIAANPGEFIIWDIGLGGAANAVTVLRAIRAFPNDVRLVSFDNTLEPLQFAVNHAAELGYLEEYTDVLRRLVNREPSVEFADGAHRVHWEVHQADFPSWLQEYVVGAERAIAPDVILFDAFSPAKNPAMWTAPLFANLFKALDPQRPCSLATYSRSTMFRISLLLAGFYVGAGHGTGRKEETTVAANDLALIAEPLDAKWLERARKSTSAEPLWEPVYRQAPLTPETLAKLEQHPQFRS